MAKWNVLDNPQVLKIKFAWLLRRCCGEKYKVYGLGAPTENGEYL